MLHLRAKQGHSHPFSTAPPLFLSIHLLVPTHYPNSPWRLVSFSQQSSGPGAQALLHPSLLALTTHAPHPHFTSAHLTGTLPSPDLLPFLEVEAQVPKFTWPICTQLCLLLHARMFLDLLPLNPPLFHVHCHHLMAWPYSLASHKPKILSFSYPFATHYICLEDFQMKNDSNTCHLCSFMLSAECCWRIPLLWAVACSWSPGEFSMYSLLSAFYKPRMAVTTLLILPKPPTHLLTFVSTST